MRGCLHTKACILALLYTATADHEDEAKRNPNGAWRKRAGSIRRQPKLYAKLGSDVTGYHRESVV